MKKQLMGAAVASIVTIGAIGTIGAIQIQNEVAPINMLSMENQQDSFVATDADYNGKGTQITVSITGEIKDETLATATMTTDNGTAIINIEDSNSKKGKLVFDMTSTDETTVTNITSMNFDGESVDILALPSLPATDGSIPSNYTEVNIALDFVSDASDNGIIDIDPTLGTELIIYADPSKEATEAGEVVTSVEVILNSRKLEVEKTSADSDVTSVWNTTISAEDIHNGENTLDITINTKIGTGLKEKETLGLTINHTFEGAPVPFPQIAIVGIVIGSLAVVGLVAAGGGYYFSTTKKSS